eukprot:1961241-Alexandrium_andersonii.AAC.1
MRACTQIPKGAKNIPSAHARYRDCTHAFKPFIPPATSSEDPPGLETQKTRDANPRCKSPMHRLLIFLPTPELLSKRPE